MKYWHVYLVGVITYFISMCSMMKYWHVYLVGVITYFILMCSMIAVTYCNYTTSTELWRAIVPGIAAFIWFCIMLRYVLKFVLSYKENK